MSKWKRYACFVLLLGLFCQFFSTPTTALEASPSLSAKASALIEAESMTLLLSQNADQRLPMASTTKIATAIVALSLASPDTVVKVHEEAVGVEGSSVYLVAGEELTLEQLLYALLLESANDAAAAIAYGISGSIETFAEQMNRYAASIGLSDTHFTNPHGLYDDEHYTTARELAILTCHALQNETFATIVATRKASIPHADTGTERLLINHNKLLRSYEGCIGVKTGYTQKSGRCLVSAAKRDGVTLIAVTLDAPDDWSDHTRMLDYGFSRLVYKTLCTAEEYLFPLPVIGGEEPYVMVSNPEQIGAVLPTEHGSMLVRIEAPRFLWAKIEAGERVGRVVFFCDLESNGRYVQVGEAELIAAYTVERSRPQNRFWQWLRSLFSK